MQYSYTYEREYGFSRMTEQSDDRSLLALSTECVERYMSNVCLTQAKAAGGCSVLELPVLVRHKSVREIRPFRRYCIKHKAKKV